MQPLLITGNGVLKGMRVFKFVAFVAAWFFATVSVAMSGDIESHFFGIAPQCARPKANVLIVSDTTLTGEIDDTVSLHMYHRLEQLGCIKVIGVVSMFGNGGSSSDEVHGNLLIRLAALRLTKWRLLAGPSARMPFDAKAVANKEDSLRLSLIADVINSYEDVVITELGPFTVSAMLLSHRLVDAGHVLKILGVGGRSPRETFSTGKGIPFAFRDMNVAEDRAAIGYLVKHYGSKLWLVTYRTGIGHRMLRPEQIEAFGGAAMGESARHRAKTLRYIGYGGSIPCWDTWTTLWFIDGGAERLGCKKIPARMSYSESGFRPSDSMQLQLFEGRETVGSIDVCHEKSEN